MGSGIANRGRRQSTSALAREDDAEGAEFFVHGGIVRLAEGVGDLGAEGEAEALTEAHEGLPQGGVAHAEFGGEGGLVRNFAAGAEEGAQAGEDIGSSAGGVVEFDFGHGGFEHGGSPV